MPRRAHLDEPLSPQNQANLAERIYAGDRAAEDELARLFNQRVFLMMLARTRDVEVARDLAQDVLVAVLRALRNGQMREAERLAAFVHGIARNLVNNYFRSYSREPKAEPLCPDLQVAQYAREPEAEEQVHLVRVAVERLDSVDRKILLMTLVEGLKTGEIASRLNLTPGAVSQRKCRAVKKVAEYIQKLSRKWQRQPQRVR